MNIAEKIKAARKRVGLSQQELAEEGERVPCTLREPMTEADPDKAVLARWPDAVRIDWMLLRHDFGPAGRVLNALSFGWFGMTWRLFHQKECDVNRCRYYLVDHFDEHIFLRVQDGEMYITPLGRRVLRSELDTFCHEGKTYMGVGKIKMDQK